MLRVLLNNKSSQLVAMNLAIQHVFPWASTKHAATEQSAVNVLPSIPVGRPSIPIVESDSRPTEQSLSTQSCVPTPPSPQAADLDMCDQRVESTPVEPTVLLPTDSPASGVGDIVGASSTAHNDHDDSAASGLLPDLVEPVARTSSSNTQAMQLRDTSEPSVTEVPYMTARIFHGEFTYKFSVTPGPKFLRLYFYPNEYSGLDVTTSFFSVSANNYTLFRLFTVDVTTSFFSK
ncbi:hypothetical protein V6N12_033824 [Hibiscus sabdariffa]|uniref:Malectin-like domain-containing protein n=1 Tax=Hibiscus sabdariffa TaxID=183260 RepID=A0ABR2A796_9ROSI